MHEWALAESVVQTALKVADKENIGKITQCKVVLGELQQIDKDTFRFAIKQIADSHHSQFDKVEVLIETEKTGLLCQKCGHSWDYENVKGDLTGDQAEAIHFIPEVVFVHTRCPQCGGVDFGIAKGRGIYLATIEGER